MYVGRVSLSGHFVLKGFRAGGGGNKIYASGSPSIWRGGGGSSPSTTHGHLYSFVSLWINKADKPRDHTKVGTNKGN
jgi:hypothetical protein